MGQETREQHQLGDLPRDAGLHAVDHVFDQLAVREVVQPKNLEGLEDPS